MFKRKKKEPTLAQMAARFRLSKVTRKLNKKDLEIVIDGQKFHFEDRPLKKKG